MSLEGIMVLMPSECEYCKIIFEKKQPYEDVCRHINGLCKETPVGITMNYGYSSRSEYHRDMLLTEEEFEKRRKEKNQLECDMLDMSKYMRTTDKMFLADVKIQHEDMIAFGKGWWKGWKVGLIGGLLLGSMWMWIAIEICKL